MKNAEIFDSSVHTGMFVFEGRDVPMDRAEYDAVIVSEWSGSLKVWTEAAVVQLLQRQDLSESDLNRLAGLKAGLALLQVENQ